MIDEIFAKQFAAQWIDAWNAHDFESVLAHYADDFEITSPVIARLQIDATGLLRGKLAIEAYWRRAIQFVPELQFELVSVMAGVQSLVINYKGAHGRMASEVFFFNTERRVSRASAHYQA